MPNNPSHKMKPFVKNLSVFHPHRVRSYLPCCHYKLKPIQHSSHNSCEKYKEDANAKNCKNFGGPHA